jgi:hypothetical protein
MPEFAKSLILCVSSIALLAAAMKRARKRKRDGRPLGSPFVMSLLAGLIAVMSGIDAVGIDISKILGPCLIASFVLFFLWAVCVLTEGRQTQIDDFADEAPSTKQ